MLLYNSQFLRINYILKEKKLYCNWISTKRIDDDIYKVEMSEFTKIIKTHKPEKIAFDAANFSYIVVPSMQEWQKGILLPEWKKSGVKKVAILYCNDFFSQRSLEQLFSPPIFESTFFWNNHQVEDWFSKSDSSLSKKI